MSYYRIGAGTEKVDQPDQTSTAIMSIGVIAAMASFFWFKIRREVKRAG
jgi:hypothetical protein